MQAKRKEHLDAAVTHAKSAIDELAAYILYVPAEPVKPVEPTYENEAGDFGIAPGNSAQDNAAAWRKAFLESFGGEVYFSPGDYYFDNTEPITLFKFSGRFVFADDARLVFTNPQGHGINLQQCSGYEIDGLTYLYDPVPGTRNNQAAGYLAWNCSDGVLRNAEASYSPSSGFIHGKCERIKTYNTYAHDTMADGLHFANSTDCESCDHRALNTGDDGLAFVNYGSESSGGYAKGTKVKNAGTRGITAVGQSGVLIEYFEVVASHSAGIYVAQESSYNTPAPSNVTYRRGTITDAGKGDKGNGGGDPLPDSIFYTGLGAGVVFEDITSIAPARDHVGGGYSGEEPTLTNITRLNS